MAVLKNKSFRVPEKPAAPFMGTAPRLLRDEKNGRYILYASGRVYASRDLLSWEDFGEVQKTIPEACVRFMGGQYAQGQSYDLVSARSETRLYGSLLGEDGKTCLYVASAADPLGPFAGRLGVLYSNPGEPAAVDPCVAEEAGGGFERNHALIYGRGGAGLFALQLNPRNGLAFVEGFGRCIARRPKWLCGSVSAGCVRYNPDTQYYYLFYTAGEGGEAQIRAGRSLIADGPYLDATGHKKSRLHDLQRRPFHPLGARR